jgi:flavin-dependent dehydrogenase
MKTKLFLSLVLCASAHCHGMELIKRWQNVDPDEYPVRREMHDGLAVTPNEQIILTTNEYGGLLVGASVGTCCPAPGSGIVRGIMLGYCSGKIAGAATVAVWRCCECERDGEKKRK